jgi:type IV secretion system protein TrbL
MKRLCILTAIVPSLLLALIVAAPAAQLPQAPAGFLNDIQNQYQAATGRWLAAAMGWATVIFAGLITVEIAWSVFEIFIKNRDVDSLLGSFIFRIVWVGTAVFLLNQAPNIVIPAIQDFINIGTSIAGSSGVPVGSTPDAVFGQGFAIAKDIWGSTGGDNIVSQALAALPQVVGGGLVLVSYAVVAAQLLLTEVQVFFVVGAGAFLLGFMGSRWTLPFAETYPRMVLVSGLKLIAITLVVGLGQTLAVHWEAAASRAGVTPLDFLSIGSSTLVFAILAWNLPNLMAAFAGASPAFNAAAIVGAGANLAASGARAAGRVAGGGGGGGGGGSKSSQIASIEKATSLE